MTDDELLGQARDRFTLAVDDARDNRELFMDDLHFYAGEQWPDRVRKDRELQDRPVLTVNRIPGFVRQVTNEQRQNRPSIKVRPADSGADVETAEIFSGLIRHIEANSKAELAYDNAFFYAVSGGFGFFRVVTDYCDDGSFDQEILIKPIVNPLTVYFDHQAKSLDGATWRYCFVTEDMPREEFERKYPDQVGGWDEVSGDAEGWVTDDTVRLAEYWYVVEEAQRLLRLEDGTILAADEYAKLPSETRLAIAEERTVKRRAVRWAKLGGHSVLERGEWAGKWIPIIPVFGDMVYINGRIELFSLVRFAKDAQRMLNYYRSTETELLALQPKAPYIAAEGQVEGYETLWGNANKENYSFLPYKPTTVAGIAVPPPQRQPFASPPTGVMQGAVNAQQDLMSTVGIYEAGLGQRSNETSGRAILARQREGDVGTYHFIDNMTRAIEQCGRILIDLIPKIYDTPRMLRILGEDGSEKMMTVNQPVEERDEFGQNVIRVYDLTVGRYDLIVAAGPSYSTRRQEAADSMMQMVQSNPQIMGVAGDLIVKSMDWPGAEQLAERLKKMLPPALQEKDEEAPQLPPEVQLQMQQHEQLIQQLDQTIQQMTAELEKRDLEKMKVQIDAFNAETNRLKVKGELELKAEELYKESEADTTEMDKAQLDAQVRMMLQEREIEAKRELEQLRMQADLLKEKISSGVLALDANGHVVQGEMIGTLMKCAHELRKEFSMEKEIVRDANGRPIGLRPIPADEPEDDASEMADVKAAIGIDDVMKEMLALRTLMSAPREVIKDAEGRVVGVRTVLEVANAG
jgi:hypothetical protein